MKRIVTCLLLLAMAGSAGAETGNPSLKSIDALTFGPDGLLIVGDGRGGQVVAIQTGDVTLAKGTWTGVKNLKAAIGARLGTDAKGIEIGKLAVNPASQTAYAAIRLVSNKSSVLVTIKPDGTIRDFPTESVEFTRYRLPAGEKSPITKITDVTWAGDRILVAAQANETFASKIVSIVPKANEEAVCYSTETYHVAHKAWETKAPIRTVLPYEENGKRYLVGAFTCKPIVKFPLDEMKPGGQVKGISLMELGSGNTPQNMFRYEKDGRSYILISTFRFQHEKNPVGPSPYWAAKVDYSILGENTKVNQDAIWRIKGKASVDVTDRATVARDYFGVMQMDRLDANRALVIRTLGKDDVELTPLPLP